MASNIVNTPHPFDVRDYESEAFELNNPRRSVIAGEPGLQSSLEMLNPEAAITKSDSITGTTQLTVSNIFALLVGGVIGSGIFSSPSQIDINVPSPGVAILIWICGGLVAWAGAASFAELGAAIPTNGGMQEYLNYIYGDLLASTMSWTWIMAVKPSSMAILSMIFADYWNSILLSPGFEPFWANKLLAVVTLSTVVLVNAISAENSVRLTNSLLFVKLLTVAFIAVIAILVASFNLNAEGDRSSQDWWSRNWFTYRARNKDSSTIEWATLDNWELLGYYTTALYAGLWAYSGWDSVSH